MAAAAACAEHPDMMLGEAMKAMMTSSLAAAAAGKPDAR